MNVKELIEILSKFPEDAVVNYQDIQWGDDIDTIDTYNWKPIIRVEYGLGRGVEIS